MKHLRIKKKKLSIFCYLSKHIPFLPRGDVNKHRAKHVRCELKPDSVLVLDKS